MPYILRARRRRKEQLPLADHDYGFNDAVPDLAEEEGLEPPHPFGCEFSKLVRLPFRHSSKN